MAVSLRDRALLAKLSLLVVAMFAFAVFVMPPLYNLFCDILGLSLIHI